MFSPQITVELGAEAYYESIGEHSVNGRAESMLELELLWVALVQVVVSPISRVGVSISVFKLVITTPLVVTVAGGNPASE